MREASLDAAEIPVAPPLPRGAGSPKGAPHGKSPLPRGKGVPPGKAQGGRAGPSPRGKGGPPPPPGKAKALPSWQAPRLSADWQPDRVVNWQPIRQEGRLAGSVWQQVHASMQDGSAPPPDSLLARFMRKVSDATEVTSPQLSMKQQTAPSRRALPRKSALVADINYALLTRKGINSPRQLRWVVGPPERAGETALAPLPEEVLETVVGLLGAVVGEEQQLCGACAGSDPAVVLVRAERFLQRLLTEVAPLDTLRCRAGMSLDVCRVPVKCLELDELLHMVLGAVWSVMDSKVVPVLLEGVLLLGNYVNASSRNLGGALGVTLESLTKLAHTQCLPPEVEAKPKARRQMENALEILVQHLEQTRPGFSETLARDLDGCHVVRDFDLNATTEAVQELGAQVSQLVRHVTTSTGDEPPALGPARLKRFLAEAVPQVAALRGLLAKLNDAAAALRKWFAEPESSALGTMLQQLASVRESLPVSRTGHRSSKGHPTQAPQPPPSAAPDAGGAVSPTAPPSLDPKQLFFQEYQSPPAPAAEGVSAPEPSAVVGEGAKRQPLPSLKIDLAEVTQAPVDASSCSAAPAGAVAQILSFSRGALWVSWSFDWEESLPATLARKTSTERAFVVEQVGNVDGEDGPQQQPTPGNCDRTAATWTCSHPPLRIEVPLGRCYTFRVRAVLWDAQSHVRDGTTPESGAGASAVQPTGFGGGVRRPLWQSSSSTLVSADLRCAEHAAKGSRRKATVASNISSFIKGLHADAGVCTASSPGRAALRREAMESVSEIRVAGGANLFSSSTSLPGRTAEPQHHPRDVQVCDQPVEERRALFSSDVPSEGQKPENFVGPSLDTLDTAPKLPECAANGPVLGPETSNANEQFHVDTDFVAQVALPTPFRHREKVQPHDPRAKYQAPDSPLLAYGSAPDLDDGVMKSLASALQLLDTHGEGSSCRSLQLFEESTMDSSGDASPMDDTGTSLARAVSLLDDDALQRMARAFSTLEHYTGVGGENPKAATSAPSMQPKAPVHVPKVERAPSIFDDEDLQRMASYLAGIDECSDAGDLKRIENALVSFDESTADTSLGTPCESIDTSASGPARPSASSGRRATASTIPGGQEQPCSDGDSTASEVPDNNERLMDYDFVDGNEVLAAMEREYTRRHIVCKACGGSGHTGLFGGAGFGLFKTPCSSCAGSEQNNADRGMPWDVGRPGIEESANMPSRMSASLPGTQRRFDSRVLDASPTSSPMPPSITPPLGGFKSQTRASPSSKATECSAATGIASLALSSCSRTPSTLTFDSTSDMPSNGPPSGCRNTLPFLAAPHWAAKPAKPAKPAEPAKPAKPAPQKPPPEPDKMFRLHVQLEHGGEMMEFHEDMDLRRLVGSFVAKNHMLDRFVKPLMERAEQMLLCDEAREDHVDVVDLV